MGGNRRRRVRLKWTAMDTLCRRGWPGLEWFPGLPKDGSEARLAGIHHALCTNVFHCNGHQFQVTCSLGVSWYKASQDNARSLIERADQALYAAKANGRNRVEVG